MSLQQLRLLLLASVSALFILGCGGTSADPDSPLNSSQGSGSVHEQALCSARCTGGPSISCSGSTCQAFDYQYVICDGTRTNCPAPPPICSATYSCESGPTLSCTGTQCRQLNPLSIKVCGGVECNGVVSVRPAMCREG
jgi:hypothetical protein